MRTMAGPVAPPELLEMEAEIARLRSENGLLRSGVPELGAWRDWLRPLLALWYTVRHVLCLTLGRHHLTLCPEIIVAGIRARVYQQCQACGLLRVTSKGHELLRTKQVPKTLARQMRRRSIVARRVTLGG